MPNRNLNSDELVAVGRLLSDIHARLVELSGHDKELLFAYRRKVFKELSYAERGKPGLRARLKKVKRTEQAGLCKICGLGLPEKYAVLDRLNAVDGYTVSNTQLIHRDCDTEIQKTRKYR